MSAPSFTGEREKLSRVSPQLWPKKDSLAYYREGGTLTEEGLSTYQRRHDATEVLHSHAEFRSSPPAAKARKLNAVCQQTLPENFPVRGGQPTRGSPLADSHTASNPCTAFPEIVDKNDRAPHASRA